MCAHSHCCKASGAGTAQPVKACAHAGTLWYAVAVALASATKMYRANEDGRALPVLLLAPIVASGALPAHLVCLTPLLPSVLWGLVLRIALPLWLYTTPSVWRDG